MAAVATYTVPSNVKEVRQFLGLASYYHRFVPCFAKTAAPLHQLLAKSITFDWTPECQQAFEDLKGKLVSSPVLAFLDFDKSLCWRQTPVSKDFELCCRRSKQMGSSILWPMIVAPCPAMRKGMPSLIWRRWQWSGQSATFSIISTVKMSP